jgi:hypothetical protein
VERYWLNGIDLVWVVFMIKERQKDFYLPFPPVGKLLTSLLQSLDEAYTLSRPVCEKSFYSLLDHGIYVTRDNP